MAAWLAIDAVRSFEAAIEISPWKAIGAQMRFTFTAGLTQRCVVTHEPLLTEVKGEGVRRFWPEADGPREEIEVKIDEVDPPDLFAGRAIDAGAVLSEELALQMDPYPRSENAGAEASPDAPELEKKPNPFAILAPLKNVKKSGPEGT